MRSSSRTKKESDEADRAASPRRRAVLPVLILAVAVLSWLSSRYLFQLMLIQGESMEPAYHSFQPVLLDHRAAEFGEGDVVAFRSRNVRTLVVKRIAACPGSNVQIVNGRLLVDGEPSPFFSEKAVYSDPGQAAEELYLPPGQYFVLGDNPDHSSDSRFEVIGLVDRSDIVGKILPQRTQEE